MSGCLTVQANPSFRRKLSANGLRDRSADFELGRDRNDHFYNGLKNR